MVDWTKLPEELLRMIAIRSFSAVELKRFRSVCKTWHSSVSVSDSPISRRTLIKLNPLVVSISNPQSGGTRQLYGLDLRASLSRASFFRITPSSSTSKGWLIKSDVDINLMKLHLINPLSRLPFKRWSEGVNLWDFTVTEIQESYLVIISRSKEPAYGFKKLILNRDNRVIGIGCDEKIRYWNGENWIRIKDQVGHFSDIIVYNGLTYALDSRGIVWWISSSLNIFRYGPALDEDNTNDSYRDLSLVGCCGELYIVDRVVENPRKRKADSLYDNSIDGVVLRYYNVIHDDAGNNRWKFPGVRYSKTVGFKVYKMDEEIGKWVEAKSLEGNAFVMATDTSFSVLAHDFYGCVPNSIYFTENEKENNIHMFKLDDGNISSMYEPSDTSFQMFVPSFL